jgi:membrane protease YdiL (CAAX protease family)
MEERQNQPQESIPMLQPVAAEPPVEVFPVPKKQRGQAWIAWIVIFLVVAAIVVLQNRKQEAQTEGTTTATKGGPAPLKVMQARFAVGAKNALPFGEDANSLLEQLKAQKTDSLQDRLSYVILVGEFNGPLAAHKELQTVMAEVKNQSPPPEAKEKALLAALDRLYREYAHLEKRSLSAAEQELLQEQLGWFGELALAPRPMPAYNQDLPAAIGGGPALLLSRGKSAGYLSREEVLAPAQQTFYTMSGVASSVVILGFLGFIGLCILGVLAANGSLQGGLKLGSGNGGIYAETFAIWLPLFFFGLSVAIPLLVPEQFLFLGMAIAFILSLGVLAWPVLRGVPLATMLKDIGLTTHGKPLKELLWGFGCYALTIPFMIVGALLMMVLIFIQQVLQRVAAGEAIGDPASPDTAAHPIVGHLANPDWGLLVQILLVASVAAPIVEETMFRGVLYRHLREITGRWGFVLSALISGLVASFIFAVIHPQGILAVPLLMSLAFGFNIFREWRNSLIPCMIAHGLSNGLVLTVTVLSMS